MRRSGLAIGTEVSAGAARYWRALLRRDRRFHRKRAALLAYIVSGGRLDLPVKLKD